jgi:hypothetical protein
MKSKKEIFRDILISAETNCVLKIKLKNAPNPVITAVDRVLQKKIVLKPTCLYGYKIKQPVITLTEIENVTRYKTHFNSPLFEKMRFVKDNISHIRKNFGVLNHTTSEILKPGMN